MTTVLTEHAADGVRKCDAKCHTAKPGSPCDCVCKGAFHAIASRVALGDVVNVSVPGEMLPVEIKGLGEIWQGERFFDPIYLVFSRAGDSALVEFVNAAGESRPLKHFRLHSQSFEWGYAGSGPADTARSILIALGDPDPSPAIYQALKDVCIAHIPEKGGCVPVESIYSWRKAIGPDGTTATTVLPFIEKAAGEVPDGAEPSNGSGTADSPAGVPAPHPGLIAGMDHAEPKAPDGSGNGNGA